MTMTSARAPSPAVVFERFAMAASSQGPIREGRAASGSFMKHQGYWRVKASSLQAVANERLFTIC
jgi:hypothetical protein